MLADTSQNQWVEYDVETGPDTLVQEVATTQVISEQVVADHTDASAIKALLDLQSNSLAKGSRPTSLDISQETTEGQPDFLTLGRMFATI